MNYQVNQINNNQTNKTMRTRKEAELKRREVVKNAVRRFFKSEEEAGMLEFYDWAGHGLSIIKKELYSYYQDYAVHWDTITQQWTVMHSWEKTIVAS